IPDLLRAAPHVRPVLDRYGLRGCGGPDGPQETLAFFAHAHDVPVDRLIAELRAAVTAPPISSAKPQAAPAADAIYRPFFRAGIAVVLTLGAAWGAYLLLRIAATGTFAAAGLHEVNAHGHAQIFGWVGLFVMGFAYQAFPRFKHTTLARPRLATLSWWLMVGGVVTRAVAEPLAGRWPWAFWPAVAAAVVELVAIGLFVAVLAATWRASGKPLAFYDGFIISALVWFVIQAVGEAVYLAATLRAAGPDLVALVATWQAPLRDVQIHGFATLMILGVSQRVFHHFYGLPAANPRISRWALVVLNAAVAGEVLGLVLMRSAGHAWAALWYGSVLVLLAAAAVLVRGWHIFTPAAEPDRSLKFLRAAYVWLFVSLGMLALLPAYQFVLLPRLAPDSAAVATGFSHAYYGATRHAITVGFVSLMIVGVAAKVVPTLNGVPARALPALWVPFVLINVGCTLRVVGQTLTDVVPAAFPVTGVSGVLEVTGLAVWGVHLWRVMRHGQMLADDEPVTGPVTAEHRVGAVLERRPELLPTFLAFGFRPLANPLLRRTLARGVSVGQACRLAGVDAATFLSTLNGHSAGTGATHVISLAVVDAPPPAAAGCSCCEDHPAGPAGC
ncbi:MAG TPA: DUF1858 domain-containing protein, partial [Gemmataceae bacterium]